MTWRASREGSVVKIAVIAGNREVVGGAELYLRWLLPALLGRGHELALGFERSLVDPERAIERGLQLPSWSLPELGREAWLDRLQRFRPDVAYVHGIEDPDLESALATNFPGIFYAHAYHGSCATGTRFNQRPGLEVCQRRFGTPCLAANFLLGCGARRPDTFYKLYRQQRRRADVMHGYRFLAVASRYVRDVYVRQGMPAEKVSVLPYPTLDFERAPAAPGARPFTNRVLFVGRVTAVKGLEHAVRATALAQQWLGRRLALSVAGQGPKLTESVALARELGVELDAPGWVAGTRKRTLFAGADALIVPSLWAEPFGIVGIEAACIGLPAVAYAVGGIVDWLVPGVNGELARSLESTVLGEALVRALASSEHHQRLRLGAWEAARRYAPGVHLDGLERLFAAAQTGEGRSND